MTGFKGDEIKVGDYLRTKTWGRKNDHSAHPGVTKVIEVLAHGKLLCRLQGKTEGEAYVLHPTDRYKHWQKIRWDGDIKLFLDWVKGERPRLVRFEWQPAETDESTVRGSVIRREFQAEGITPGGYWITVNGKRRLCYRGATRSFAHLSDSVAARSFYHRRTHALWHAKRGLAQAELALEAANAMVGRDNPDLTTSHWRKDYPKAFTL